MTVTLLRGDALHLPIADHTVDLVVTSPPYFGLRSYQDGGQHYAGQIGSEATPAEWVDAMLAATREMVRVLKPSGSIWVNLGDKYNSAGGVSSQAFGTKRHAAATQTEGTVNIGTIAVKSLIGLPWRYALACIDQLGLILRAEVIWSKPNGLPESVTDRVRRSHETWFHFTKQPRYFAAVDEIREAQTGTTKPQAPREMHSGNGITHRIGGTDGTSLNSLGKLPGSVWSIPSQPLTVPPDLGVDHFAAFPMEWPRRLIAGWSPAGVCVACGEGRRPVVKKTITPTGQKNNPAGKPRDLAYEAGGAEKPKSGYGSDSFVLGLTTATITGYVCACPDTTAPTTPAVVADVFGGTGTTALVAHVMGRHGISVDLSADYCRLAAWRTTDPGQLAQAAQVEKPPVQTVGQDTLFDGFESQPKPRGNAGSSIVGIKRPTCSACGYHPRSTYSTKSAACERCGQSREAS